MDELLTPEQLAEYLHASVNSLANDRYMGVGVPFVRVGRRIRYRRLDVVAYLEANRFSRTDTRVAVTA